MGDLKPANLPGIGPGKGPPLPAEQFTLYQIGRQGGTINGDQRPILAMAKVVDGAGDQFLSRTGLTQDEDRCFLSRHLFRSKEYILKTIAFSKNMVHSMSICVLLTKINMIGLELVF